MQLKAYSDFSLRVLIFAALRGEHRLTIDEVAASFKISRNHLVKIVHDLSCRGYLTTYRGVGGGFVLARPAEEIGVGEVIRRCEESEAVIDCVARREGPCRIRVGCRLKGILDEAAAAFFQTLDRYTVADLVVHRDVLERELSSRGDE